MTMYLINEHIRYFTNFHDRQFVSMSLQEYHLCLTNFHEMSLTEVTDSWRYVTNITP